MERGMVNMPLEVASAVFFLTLLPSVQIFYILPLLFRSKYSHTYSIYGFPLGRETKFHHGHTKQHIKLLF